MARFSMDSLCAAIRTLSPKKWYHRIIAVATKRMMLNHTQPKAYLPESSLDTITHLSANTAEPEPRFLTVQTYHGSRVWASIKPAGLVLLQQGIDTRFCIEAASAETSLGVYDARSWRNSRA